MTDHEQNNGAGLAPNIEARRDVLTTTGGGMSPKNLGEAMEFARMMAASNMVPNDYAGKPGNVLVAVQMGAELGLPPMQAIQNIAVINGRAALWGDALLAVVMSSPAFEFINEMNLADIAKANAATCVIKRRGSPEHVVTFSVEDAKAAGLWGKSGPWTQYPNRMLLLRARGFACRDKFPDSLRGIQLAEEVIDVPMVTAKVTSSVPSGIADRIKSRRAEPQDKPFNNDPDGPDGAPAEESEDQ